MVRVRIRTKLAAALAVPLGALVAVTMLEVASAARTATTVRRQTALAEVALGPSSVLTAIENERNAASVHLLGQEGDISLYEGGTAEIIADTDEAIASFESEVGRQGADVQAAFAPGLATLAGLDELRARVEAMPDDQRSLANMSVADEVFEGYATIMRTFAVANEQVAASIDDIVLRRGALLVHANSEQTDLVASIAQDLFVAQVGGAADGLNTPSEVSAVASQLAEMRAIHRRLGDMASGRFEPLVDELLTSDEVQTFPSVVDNALGTGHIDLPSVLESAAGDDPDTLAYNVFAQRTKEAVRAEADRLEAEATSRQRWFSLAALTAVAAATIITWLVSRSITRPLQTLTRQAKSMAEWRLPDAVKGVLDTPLGEDVTMPRVEPVAVDTRDEVTDVAAALNAVQDTALSLAVEQAVLRRNIADSFVNLGRRNQNLLARQLDFITELESAETDPDTLGDLFRLDHLATRMRRNAESLLVLAGIEQSRKWAAPIGVTDVIRAALGEVEDYQRAAVRDLQPATILGPATTDLAHLLAELIENALMFSPPDQPVEIRGRWQEAGAYALAVIDFGHGMSRDEVDAANRRLAGAESFTVAPSKYLGHYVAGNLAARHGIRVRLDSARSGGVTATVELPAGLATTTALEHPRRAVRNPPPFDPRQSPLWAYVSRRDTTRATAPRMTATPSFDDTAGGLARRVRGAHTPPSGAPRPTS